VLNLRPRTIGLFAALILSACADNAEQTNAQNANQRRSEASTANEPQQSAIDYQARIDKANSEESNWLLHGRTLDEQRYSPLAQINTETVGSLELAWYKDLPEPRGQEASPIIRDGVMYTTAAWSEVFALDATSGEQLWHFDPEVNKAYGVKACCDVVNRGVAVWGDTVLIGVLDGRLIALDANNGKQKWSVSTVDSDKPYTITGAPRIANGKVFIGNGGAEFGVRGYVSAYDISNGELLWRFYTVPGDPSKPFENPILEEASKTWSGEWWTLGGGGTAWDSMAYDPELNLLYVGVGNGSPWNPNVRSAGEGDNLFLSSIVALNADTGAYAWHYQTTPGEAWDYTATQHMILADLEEDGDVRKVIMQAPKNGFFYVLDRQTGEFISGEPYVATTWAKSIDPETGRPIVEKEAEYWKTGKVALVAPSWAGGHSWHPMSFHPEHQLVYIPAQEMAFPYMQQNDMKVLSQGANLGVDTSVAELPDDESIVKAMQKETRGHLAAWDPVEQKEKWRVQHAGVLNGGVLSTAGNLVFQGNGEGFVNAYNASTGEKLWEFAAQTGVVAPPVSYAVDGHQYITVSAGWGGIVSLMTGPFTQNAGQPINRSRLLTFKIGGKATLPPVNDTPRTMPALPEDAIDTKQVRRGFELYDDFCVNCHGAGAVGGGVVPDLRYSGFLLNTEGWQQVVRKGALANRGMVSFADEISQDGAEAIRNYIMDRNQYAHSIGDTQRISR